MESLRALSIYQPWAELIASGQKTIETRAWRNLPLSLVGQRLAIHASQTCDPRFRDNAPRRRRGAEDEMRQIAGHPVHLAPGQNAWAYGAVVATAKVVDVRRLYGFDGMAALCECDGLVGIILSDIIRVEPVLYVPGQRGIFRLPAPEIIRRSTRPLPFPSVPSVASV